MPSNILLINEIEPFFIKTLKHAHLPLWAGIIKSLTPENYLIDFVDCSFESLHENKLQDYDLVCLSALTPNAYNVYKWGDICRDLGVACIIGGPHASVVPEEAKAHCDSVVIGECEGIWKELLNDFSSGKLRSYYPGVDKEYDCLPYLDRSIFRKYNYSFDTVEVMRGCPYRCEFCTIAFFSKGKCKYKQIHVFERELEEIRQKNVILVGPNLPVDKDRAKQIFDVIKRYRLRWGMYASADLIINKEDILNSLANAGCYVVEIGFENPSYSTLKSMKKYHHLKVDYKKIVHQLHDRNIEVATSFIVGWDTDNKNVFKVIRNYIQELEIDVPWIFLLVPYPTTELYYRLLKENRILTSDWTRYSGTDVVFSPKMMTREELLIGYIEFFDDLSSLISNCRRVFARWRGLKRQLEMSYMSFFYYRKFLKEVRDVVEKRLSMQGKKWD